MDCLKWVNDFLQVSETGQVFSHGKFIRGEVTRNGYVRVHVQHCGIRQHFLVHRLVAEAFIPNPLNLPQVNHKDGNKLNNSVENLEWCSASENQKHAYRTGLKSADGEKNGQSKLSEKDVIEIRRTYVKGKHSEFNSYGLAKKYGVNPKTIQDIVNGKLWKDVGA